MATAKRISTMLAELSLFFRWIFIVESPNVLHKQIGHAVNLTLNNYRTATQQDYLDEAAISL
jgi:hypothetical protein